MRPQEIAATIAHRLREDPSRWGRGQTFVNRVPVCLLGHITETLAPGAAGCMSDRQLGDYNSARALFVRYTGTYIVHWNDQPQRNVEEVIALCDKVAAHAD